MRPKFGRSLRHRGLTVLFHVSSFSPGARLPATAAALSHAPHANSETCVGKRLRRRFQLCAAINGAASTAASNSALPSMAFEDRVLFPL
jgi:hypothetical protein